jgi:hypothetical protein
MPVADDGDESDGDKAWGRESVRRVAGVMVNHLVGADGEARSELTGRCRAQARPCVATMRALPSLVVMGESYAGSCWHVLGQQRGRADAGE